MLTPEQLATIPDSMDSLFRDLDNYIVSRYTEIICEACKITEEAEWLEGRAELLGIAQSDIDDEVNRVLNQSSETLYDTFEDAANMNANSEYKRFESQGLDAERIKNSEFLSQYIEAAYKQTEGEFQNLGGTIGFVDAGTFTPLYDFFIRELDRSQISVSTGVLDYQTTIKQSVIKMARNGVMVVNYDSGYRMNIASAARMITLTGVNQMARQMNEGICDEFGLDLVEITAHSGARPSHQVWQGQIYSRSGTSKKYPPLVESTGLGDVTGLCGAYCRHNYYGYFEGSPRSYSESDLKNIDPEPFVYEGDGKTYTHYEATQRMRYMERQMRYTKRKQSAYKNTDLTNDYYASSIKLRLQENEYVKFCKAAGIRTKFERTEYIEGT